MRGWDDLYLNPIAPSARTTYIKFLVLSLQKTPPSLNSPNSGIGLFYAESDFFEKILIFGGLVQNRFYGGF